jgi:transposase
MHFVTVKTEGQQARAMLFRTRDLLLRQRTQLINALRGHLAEHGIVAPRGPANVKVLAEAIEETTGSLPLLVVELSRVFLEQIDGLAKRIAELEKATVQEAARGATTRRLQTMPGIGPITAMAIETFAPPMATFKRGRDFAAWLGLAPRQHSTGGKQLLGKISKMGQHDIRQLLIIGAMTIVRWACRKGAPVGTWLHRMLAHKPRMLVAIALANKMARSIWAMLTKSEDYRVPVATTT